jgi:dihydrofolate reductase
MTTIVSLIAAVSADGFISRGQGVPWKLPADLKHFRAYTAGKWLLLGLKTYKEMIGWYREDQHPLVVNLDASYQPPVGQRVSSVTEAIDLAKAADQPELVVVGGRSVFDASMPHAHRLVITHVHEILGGGVPFAPFSPQEWEPISREAYPLDAEHPQSFEIVVYERIRRFEKAA